MCRAAARRNRGIIDRGQVTLERTTAAAPPWADRTFDGAITVNTIQMWEPLDRSIAEVARVQRAGARLVAITHDWALRSGHPSVDAWWETIAPLLDVHGFAGARRWQARADGGSTIGMTATRAGL